MVRGGSVRPALALSLSAVVILAAGLTVALASSQGAAPSAASAQRSVVWVGIPSEASPHAIRISSESVNTPVTDAFQITYGQGTFTLDYQRNAAQPATSHIAVTIQSIIEWNDTNADGKVTAEEILATEPLGATGFGNIPIQHRLVLSPDGGETNSFVISSNNAEVRLNLTISERFVPLGDETLTPMEAKLSIEIDHTVVHPGAKLGLQIGMQASGTVRLDEMSWDDLHEFSHGDEALNVTNISGGLPSSVFFAWQTQALVNGAMHPVTSTGPETNDTNPGTYELYLAYGGVLPSSGTVLHVVHDPNLGVVSAAYASLAGVKGPFVLQGDYAVYAVAAAVAAGIVVGSIVLTRRRRGRD